PRHVLFCLLFFHCHSTHPALHPFPTRRSSDLHILADLAHASPTMIDDILAIATRPVVVSHTGVRGTCDNNRNLSDEHLRAIAARSEEHTSELQSRENLVCRLLLEKKKTTKNIS